MHNATNIVVGVGKSVGKLAIFGLGVIIWTGIMYPEIAALPKSEDDTPVD